MEKNPHPISHDRDAAPSGWCSCRECMYAIGCLENQKRKQDIPYFCRQYKKFIRQQGCRLMCRKGYPTYTVAKYRKSIPALKPLKAMTNRNLHSEALCKNLISGKQLEMRCEYQLFALDMEQCAACSHLYFGLTCGIFCNRHGAALYKLPDTYRTERKEK